MGGPGAMVGGPGGKLGGPATSVGGPGAVSSPIPFDRGEFREDISGRRRLLEESEWRDGEWYGCGDWVRVPNLIPVCGSCGGGYGDGGCCGCDTEGDDEEDDE